MTPNVVVTLAYFISYFVIKIAGDSIVADRSQFPYQALLLYKDVPYCGGAIIGKKIILTAAHCCTISKITIKPPELSIAIGNVYIYDKKIIYDVEYIAIHERYNRETLDNDIAVIRLSDELKLTNEIKAIPLITGHLTNGQCNMSGWGLDNLRAGFQSTELMYEQVIITDWKSCNDSYGFLSNNQICAGLPESRICQSDSGSPLICQDQLAGILAYTRDCINSKVPAIYTEVFRYANWIEEAKCRSFAYVHKFSHCLFIVTFVSFITGVT